MPPLDRVMRSRSILEATWRAQAVNWLKKFISERERPTSQGWARAKARPRDGACSPGAGRGQSCWPRALTPSNFRRIFLAVTTVTGHSKLILLTTGKKKKKLRGKKKNKNVKTYLVEMSIRKQTCKCFNCLLLSLGCSGSRYSIRSCRQESGLAENISASGKATFNGFSTSNICLWSRVASQGAYCEITFISSFYICLQIIAIFYRIQNKLRKGSGRDSSCLQLFSS